MKLCSNCFRNKPKEHLFCPWCGYPGVNTGLKMCDGKQVYREKLTDETIFKTADMEFLIKIL
jgi:rRNA maturation endonuclease Nob1